MKKIIFILALFVSFVANSQYTPPTGYTNINARYDWLAGVFRALGLPAGGNAAFTAGQAQRAGSVYYDSTGADAGLKVWNGAAWVGVGEVTQSALDDTAAAIRADFPTGSAANANAGAFYRWLIPSTQEIKTFAPGYGILLDSSSNADAITAILDSATVFPDIRATISGGFGDVGADFVLSNDSLKNNEWVNIVDFGAVGDGVTDNTAAILAARDSGKDIMVPEGIFDVTGAANTSIIVLNRGQKIFGVNRFKSILKTTSSARILRLEDFCSVDNLGFLGDGSKTVADEYQAGIMLATSDTLVSITNCYFKNIGGSTSYVGGAIRVSAIENAATIGSTINNNIIEDCYNGIVLNSRGEYTIISNNKITNTHVGLWNSAGNVAVTNNTFQSCDTAHILFGGTNNGHCVSSSNTYNHNTVNLVVDGITAGYTFNGDMLYAGNVVIRNSTGIKFFGCDFSTGTITLTNNTNLYRSGRWLTMTKSLVSGEDFTVLGETKTGAGAITVFDLLNASDTAKLRGINILSGLAGNGNGVVGVDNNGQLSWSAGGSNTDDSAYHRMSQVNDTTVVFHSNVADDTLVIRGGSAGGGSGGGETSTGVMQQATYNLTSTTDLQKLFDAGGTGAITLSANTTYLFECFFFLTSMSATSGNCGFDIIGAGTATATSANFRVAASDRAAFGTSSNDNNVFIQTTARTANIATATTATQIYAKISGVLVVNAGGTIIPSVNLTDASAAVVGVGSYFKLTPIGNGSVTSW